MGDRRLLTVHKAAYPPGRRFSIRTADRRGHLPQALRIGQQRHSGIRQQLGRLSGDRAALPQEKVKIVALTASHGIHQHHRQAAGGGFGGAQAAGLGQEYIGTVHQLRHIVYHAMDMDLPVSGIVLLQLAVQLLVCAADDRQLLLRRRRMASSSVSSRIGPQPMLPHIIRMCW